jgi:replicative DNA helicase
MTKQLTHEQRTQQKLDLAIRSSSMYSAPYSFDSVFESALVCLLCSSHDAFARIGDRLIASAFITPQAQLLIEAAQRFKGGGPGSTVLLIQDLRTQLANGKIKRPDVLAAADYLEAGMDALGQMNHEVIIDQAVAVIADRLRRTAAELSVSSLTEPDMLDAAVRSVDEARRLGETRAAVSSDTDNGLDLLEEDIQHEVIRLYVPGFDDEVPTKGFVRGDQVVYLAGTSDGKGTALTQSLIAGYITRGKDEDVGYCSLEDPRMTCFLRALQNMYGVVGLEHEIAAQRKDIWRHHMVERERLGYRGEILIPDTFMPTITRPADIIQWVDASEQRTGRKMSVVVIDYADKLTVGGKNDRSRYIDAEEVYEKLRWWARDTNRWLFTASQATRRTKDKKGKNLDTDDASDSLGKMRVADVVVSLNAIKDTNDFKMYVAKWRKSKRGQVIGPFHHGFDCQRLHEMSVYPLFRPYAQRDEAPRGITRAAGAAE